LDGGQVSQTLDAVLSKGQTMPEKNRFPAVLQPTAGTLGNRGLRSHTELDGHGAYIPVAQPVPYDLFQITAPVNRQNRKPGDPCHTLARDNAAHAAVAFHPLQDPISSTDGSTHCMGTGGSQGHASIAVAFQQNQLGEVRCGNIAGTVNTNSNASGRNTPMAMQAMTVRRLSARECERLQAFPDDWTLIPWRGKPAEQCPDGPRYKALGNSMACNCMAWIGEKIAKWEAEHER
jgi:DNA (cytosine-5)-methyltransferase 1